MGDNQPQNEERPVLSPVLLSGNAPMSGQPVVIGSVYPVAVGSGAPTFNVSPSDSDESEVQVNMDRAAEFMPYGRGVGVTPDTTKGQATPRASRTFQIAVLAATLLCGVAVGILGCYLFLGVFLGDSITIGSEEDFSLTRPEVTLGSATDEAPSTSILGTDTNYTGGALLLQAGSGTSGGDLHLDAGQGTPSSASGSVLIGTSSAAAISIGSEDTTTTLNGAVVFSDPDAEVYIPSLRVGSLTAQDDTESAPFALDSDAGVALGTTSPDVHIGSDTTVLTIDADNLQVSSAQDILLDSAQSTVFNVGTTETMDFRVGGESVFTLFDEVISASTLFAPKARGGGMTVSVPTTYTSTLTMYSGNALTVDTIKTIGSNDLSVTAPTVHFSEDVEVAGSLTVSGASSLNTLGVTGASTLVSLGVTGAATVGSTLDVSEATTLNSTLGVTGKATLSGGLDVSMPTTLTSTLGVTGKATLSGGLDVSMPTTLNSTLGVTGKATLSGGLDVSM
ncbi:hypothetical protein KIPB_005964, partial [Kipferlia bialata]|eukprot:g5964.t1